MLLDDDQRQQVQAWIVQHHGAMPDCAICRAGPETWAYTIYTQLIADWTNPAFLLGYRPRRSTVELSCGRCGYLLSFDAKLMGVLDSASVMPAEAASEGPQ